MAEYYGVFDWRALPIKTAATLCAGLRPESRTKQRLSGLFVRQDTIFLASIFDQVNVLRWMQTIDAQKGRNRPEPILPVILGIDKNTQAGEVLLFDSGEEFERARERLLKGA